MQRNRKRGFNIQLREFLVFESDGAAAFDQKSISSNAKYLLFAELVEFILGSAICLRTSSFNTSDSIGFVGFKMLVSVVSHL